MTLTIIFPNDHASPQHQAIKISTTSNTSSSGTFPMQPQRKANMPARHELYFPCPFILRDKEGRQEAAREKVLELPLAEINDRI